MDYPTFALAGVSAAVLYGAAAYLKKNVLGREPYPPGPKGYPVIRNLFDVPSVDPWVGYVELGKACGTDMVFMRVFSQPLLILNSAKRIDDLMGKRSSVYSGRPHLVMMHDLLDLRSFPLMDYGPTWRKHRKMFHQYYNPGVTPEYRPMIKKHVQEYLGKLLESPNEYERHTHHLFGGTIMHMAYGYEPLPTNDPFISLALEAVEGFKTAGTRGRFLVDDIPILKYVPEWFPGAGFQRWAKYYREKDADARWKPFNLVLDRMKRNEAESCVATKMVEELPSPDDPSYQEEKVAAKDVVGVSYLAGTDATTSAAVAFIFLMATHPEIQRKARDELDRIVGVGVVPDFDQIEGLVYIKALITEVLRWHQATPLAIPHMTTEDDHYDGYFIPKGTIVLGNAWAVLHDPETFDKPLEFIPERYIADGKFNDSLPDPIEYAFGFGRRVCPGRHLALEMLYFMAVSTLAMFDILPPKDESGKDIELKPTFEAGLVVSLGRFQCTIRPRSSATEGVVRAFSD